MRAHSDRPSRGLSLVAAILLGATPTEAARTRARVFVHMPMYIPYFLYTISVHLSVYSPAPTKEMRWCSLAQVHKCK